MVETRTYMLSKEQQGKLKQIFQEKKNPFIRILTTEELVEEPTEEVVEEGEE